MDIKKSLSDLLPMWKSSSLKTACEPHHKGNLAFRMFTLIQTLILKCKKGTDNKPEA